MTEEAMQNVREDCRLDAMVDRYYETHSLAADDDWPDDDEEYAEDNIGCLSDGLDPGFASWDDYYRWRYG